MKRRAVDWPHPVGGRHRPTGCAIADRQKLLGAAADGVRLDDDRGVHRGDRIADSFQSGAHDTHEGLRPEAAQRVAVAHAQIAIATRALVRQQVREPLTRRMRITFACSGVGEQIHTHATFRPTDAGHEALHRTVTATPRALRTGEGVRASGLRGRLLTTQLHQHTIPPTTCEQPPEGIGIQVSRKNVDARVRRGAFHRPRAHPDPDLPGRPLYDQLVECPKRYVGQVDRSAIARLDGVHFHAVNEQTQTARVAGE